MSIGSQLQQTVTEELSWGHHRSGVTGLSDQITAIRRLVNEYFAKLLTAQPTPITAELAS